MPDDTLLYDGDCPMCSLGARLARSRSLEPRPYQAAVLPADLSPAHCRAALQFVTRSGRIFAGADALREVLRRRAWTRPAAWALSLPGAMALARGLYAVVARNRRAIAPTAANVRLPRERFGETAGTSIAFLGLTAGFAALATLAYGASVAPLTHLSVSASALVTTAASAAGWAVSLPIVMGLGWLWITCLDVLRQGACVMAAGVVPLIPLALANRALGPSPAANLAVLVLDGLWMLVLMAWRLRLYGLPLRLAALWFGVLEAGGIAAWALLGGGTR